MVNIAFRVRAFSHCSSRFETFFAQKPPKVTCEVTGCNIFFSFFFFHNQILCIACVVALRVTDDESRRVFHYLRNRSRERWALLNNVTWSTIGKCCKLRLQNLLINMKVAFSFVKYL